MENTENTKDQLVEDLKEIRKKISKLETVQIKNGKIKEELNQSYEKLNEIMEDMVSIVTKVAEMRDPYLRGHQKRVSKLATTIAQEMKLARDKIEGIKFAALVHDAGRFNWPTKIVNNEGQLTEEEHELIKNHPKISYYILKTVNFPWDIAEIAYQHHEKLDGSGYPKGLKDGEILMEAKIIAVADVVEAMSSKRSYRPAYSIKEVLEEILKNKGILYESQVVDACLRLFQEKHFQFNEE
ncbi:MAG: HD domain-containing protein [Candidatus Atribacteria bacterium]|nr:HD domain-containing protein [Candidatus Atribacteria bacterium]